MTAGSVQAGYHVTIGGSVSGQVAVGENIIQIGRVEGGIVYVSQPGQRAVPRPRMMPVWQRPRRFKGLLDRSQESKAAAAALQSGLPVEFYGESGVGKTAMLRHLAFRLPDEVFPGGVIYLRVQGQPLDDVLQDLFDTFYESDIPLKPTNAQMRHALQNIEALILLDDVTMARDELDALLDVAPNCTFLLATEARRLWGEGQAIALSGLPQADALSLLERELGRSLTAGERLSAARLHNRLQGHPFRLRQAASLARDRSISLMQLEAYLPDDAQQMAAQNIEALPERERRLLLALAATGGHPLSQQSLAALAGTPGVNVALQVLEQQGLIQRQGQHASLPGAVAAALQQEGNLAAYQERALDYFTQLAGAQPATLAAESGAIKHLVNWAASSGRWSEALRLVRAVEGVLAIAKRWGAWKTLLQAGLHAAQGIGDGSAEAWAWHQLGTRALCLQEKGAARAALVRALRLRQSLGEHTAAAVTRHNLKILLGPPANGQPPDAPLQPTNGGPFGSGRLPALPVLAMVMFAVAVILATILAVSVDGQGGAGGGTPAATEATIAPSVIAATETAGNTATMTTTPASTATATVTATGTLSPSLTPCQPAPPFGWVTYLVQPGDTLFSLAQVTGTTVNMIRQVNCLEEILRVGTLIWLPARPATLTPTTTPTPTNSPAPGLPDLVAAITVGEITVSSAPGPLRIQVAQSGAQFQVPLRIVVTNIGDRPAEFFVVTVALQAHDLYTSAFRAGPLAAGENVEFSDGVLIPAEWQGQTITLVAVADSCNGERLADAATCRVQEGNEDNNVALLNVPIPAYTPTPTVTATLTPTSTPVPKLETPIINILPTEVIVETPAIAPEATATPPAESAP